MRTNTILIMGIFLFLPIFSNALEVNPKYEAMDIETLIEKSKDVPPLEKVKIDKVIKQKIAQAHRENYTKR